MHTAFGFRSFSWTMVVAALALLAPLQSPDAQEPSKGDLSRADAAKRVKDIKEKLRVGAKSDDALQSLKTLEAIADELHERMQPRIADMLMHRDPVVRRQALITIGAIGVRPDSAPQVVYSLTQSLKDPDPEARALVLWTLMRIGRHSKPALPKAIEALKDLDPRVRRGAIAMIGGHLPDDKELMPVVISALDDPDDLGPDEKSAGLSSVRYIAMQHLGGHKSAAKEAAPKLVKIANSRKEDDADQWFALRTLTLVAPENPLPLKTARGWLKNKDRPPDLVKASILLLGLGAHAKDAVPDLIAIVKMEPLPDRTADASVKNAVLQAFRAMGPAAREALPTLEAMAVTDDIMLRSDVQRTIKAIQGKE